MRPWLGDEEAAAAAAAVSSGWVAQGPRVAAFEDALRRRVGGANAVAVSSCTTGLHLSLVASGVGPGDEVVVPSLSFIATANVVRYVGATPVFADVDPATLSLSAETVEPQLSTSTRAVVVAHQGGMPADLDGLRSLCDPLGITLVEDAACAIGSTYRGAPIGGHGDLVVFSFHPRKVITTGEGGMVVARDDEVAARLRRLREHGMDVSAAERHAADRVVLERYLETGFNYRMTDIQAAVGLVQLRKLDDIVARRRALAARYRDLFADVPGVATPADPPHGTSNYQSFWIVLDDGYASERDAVLGHLLAHGVAARRGIMAAHREPAYRDHPHAALPITEHLTDHALLLPLFHELTSADQDRVADAVATAARHPVRSAPATPR